MMVIIRQVEMLSKYIILYCTYRHITFGTYTYELSNFGKFAMYMHVPIYSTYLVDGYFEVRIQFYT